MDLYPADVQVIAGSSTASGCASEPFLPKVNCLIHDTSASQSCNIIVHRLYHNPAFFNLSCGYAIVNMNSESLISMDHLNKQ